MLSLQTAHTPPDAHQLLQGSPKDGGSKTPRTPKSPGGGRAARELDKRLREVLAERLAYAVAECNTYDMPTRHATALYISPSISTTATEAAESDAAQNSAAVCTPAY